MDYFERLRKKWHEVPAGELGRASSIDLLDMKDDELLRHWEHLVKDSTEGQAFSVRGWYHLLYKSVLKNKKVMDVGSGLGIDGITFAECGAEITFVDIVETNLEVLRRLCELKNISGVKYHYMKDVESLEALERDYDVIWCQGSLINAPIEVIRSEVRQLLRHLKIDGRWIELAYPRTRWEREGKLPFEKWGERTDGAGTPWVEWYDLEKLMSLFTPAQFDVVLYFEFHHSDFNWFDLVRRS